MDEIDGMLGQLADVLHDLGYAGHANDLDRVKAEFGRLRSREGRLLAAARELMRALRNDVTGLRVAPSRVEAWGRTLRVVAEAIEAAEATSSASPAQPSSDSGY